MADVRNYKRINPLDLNQNVRIGVVFPFDVSGVFRSSNTTREQVKSNIIHVLLTDPGEKYYNSRFGVGLKQLLFEQIIDTGEIEGRITSQLGLYVPEIEVKNVMVNDPPNDHKIYVTLSYNLVLNSEADSIQLNFNMS